MVAEFDMSQPLHMILKYLYFTTSHKRLKIAERIPKKNLYKMHKSKLWEKEKSLF
jgi:hypothetical protein